MDPKKATILLIEDEKIISDMYVLKFTILGLHLIVAETFDEGQKMAVDAKPDLVLLDLTLDERKDGFEILQAMKANPATAHIPVYILSNVREPENKEKGIAMGAVGFISKINNKPDEVARIVSEALEAIK